MHTTTAPCGCLPHERRASRGPSQRVMLSVLRSSRSCCLPCTSYATSLLHSTYYNVCSCLRAITREFADHPPRLTPGPCEKETLHPEQHGPQTHSAGPGLQSRLPQLPRAGGCWAAGCNWPLEPCAEKTPSPPLLLSSQQPPHASLSAALLCSQLQACVLGSDRLCSSAAGALAVLDARSCT